VETAALRAAGGTPVPTSVGRAPARRALGGGAEARRGRGGL